MEQMNLKEAQMNLKEEQKNLALELVEAGYCILPKAFYLTKKLSMEPEKAVKYFKQFTNYDFDGKEYSWQSLAQILDKESNIKLIEQFEVEDYQELVFANVLNGNKVILDFDSQKDFEAYTAKYGLPKMRGKTPNGWHLYYRAQNAPAISNAVRIKIDDGGIEFDIRTAGKGYVICLGNGFVKPDYIDRQHYKFNGEILSEDELDILPGSIEEQIQSSITISANWAPNHLTASQTKKVEKICNEHLASAQSRHSAIGNAAKRIYCQYPGLGRSADSFVVDFFIKAGKDQKEIERFLDSSWEYAQKICSTYADSPSINHIIKQLASRPELEHVIYARESFWKYNGLYWEKQSLGAIHKLVAEFNSILCRIGIGIREEIINAPLCKAIVSFLQQELLDESILEQNNTVFANTAIDTTFATKNISKSLGHTHAFAFDYEPTSERSAEWEKFLSCSFATEDERENIEKFIARCILGSFGQSGGMILLGKPGTGKSTLINALSGIIGLERSETFSFDDFQDSRNLESLEICRLAIVPDSDRFSEVRNTSILKDAVFGDAISICPKYKNRYFIKPKCGFIFAMNTLPKATDDEAWFSRFNILQMNNVVRGTEVQIDNYEQLLIEERAQIVNRCLWVYAQNSKYASTNATCLQDWLTSGLSHPARWLIEQTAQSFGDTINFDQAYVAFREWCKDEGILERFINNKKSFEIVMKEKEVFKNGKSRCDSVLKDRKFDTTLEQMASHLKLVK